MSLPQDIIPFHQNLQDTIARAGEAQWVENTPGQAWMRILWTGAETGTWAAIFRWKKGFVAMPHKHLSASHTFILSGKLKVRDGIFNAGDYVYEPNGVLHGATEALEDTDYLFICHGPLLFFDDSVFTGYLGWEEIEKLRARAAATPEEASRKAREDSGLPVET
ncbi:MAG TPA: cupin domain-containing protein [Povalibacter sp.]|uniref:cupin domain-containing protein n=1 Tax=Povalibacter sp. TaxID=1962978 RepID=UPI002BB72419|nr:cupin domain-containing protein [Povalibacter sp.]HMN46433.1 cupin domain-containing protein [Povalibacter sp.]